LKFDNKNFFLDIALLHFDNQKSLLWLSFYILIYLQMKICLKITDNGGFDTIFYKRQFDKISELKNFISEKMSIHNNKVWITPFNEEVIIPINYYIMDYDNSKTFLNIDIKDRWFQKINHIEDYNLWLKTIKEKYMELKLWE